MGSRYGWGGYAKINFNLNAFGKFPLWEILRGAKRFANVKGFNLSLDDKSKCGFWTVSQGIQGIHYRGVNIHREWVPGFQLQPRFIKRVGMSNPLLQKDILILHLLTTTTESDQNYETHNLARMCELLQREKWPQVTLSDIVWSLSKKETRGVEISSRHIVVGGSKRRAHDTHTPARNRPQFLGGTNLVWGIGKKTVFSIS